jgi:hypothetical protein
MSQQYGQSEHRLDERSQAYFRQQSQNGSMQRKLEAHKFASYVNRLMTSINSRDQCIRPLREQLCVSL